MSKKKYAPILLILSVIVLFSACDKPDPEPDTQQPTLLNLNNDWYIDSIEKAADELWYRINAPTSQKLYIEWAESAFQGSGYNLSADIMVSAYKLNGIDAYFEQENDGYGADAKLINLTDEASVLIKVEAGTALGSFGLKIYESGEANITYTELSSSTSWYNDEIAVGETKGYIVNSQNAALLQVVWAEFNSPESGFTADIKGSVYKMDGETPYLQADNGKIFVAKDKSHSDNPKAVEVDDTEGKIKVHIQLNDDAKPGTYAVRFAPVTIF